ncbi:MAG TPA: MFS transporter [Herpetosiphonaceae bacterium]
MGADKLQKIRDPFGLGQQYQLTWMAETINVLGSQVTLLAIPTLAVIVYNASAIQVTTLLAVSYLPSMLIGPLLGLLVDSISLRRLLIISDLAAALTVATVPLLMAFGLDSLLYLYVVGALIGLFQALHELSVQSLIPALVPEQDLMRGNVDLEGGRSVGRMSGWSLGGTLVQVVGASWAMLIDMASFLISAALLWRLNDSSLRQTAPPKLGFQSVLDGLRMFSRSSTLIRLTMGTFTLNLGGSVLGALYLFYVYRELQLSPSAVGVTVTLNYLGAFLGVILARRLVKRMPLSLMITISSAVAGLVLFLIPLASYGNSFIVLLVYNLIFGLVSVVWAVTSVTMRQTIIPHHLMGRVNATMRAIGATSFPIGAIVGGVASSFFGVLPTLYAAAMLASTAWIWFFPPTRWVESAQRDLAGEST